MAQREVVQRRPAAGARNVVRGTPEALRRQRARLLQSVVAVAGERGFMGTRVADVVGAAGVSRNTFYRHFRNTTDCLLAAIEEVAGEAERAMVTAFASAGPLPEQRFGEALGALMGLAASRPAAFRLWLVEGLGAGPAADEQTDRLRGLLGKLVAHAGQRDASASAMPSPLVEAIAGGLYLVVHSRLRSGRANDLPTLAHDLTTWVLCYQAPSRSLATSSDFPLDTPVRRPAVDPRGRMLDAIAATIAEKGYQGMTISEIAQRGNVSLSTFYAHFSGREEALAAVVGEHQRYLLAVTLDAYQDAPDWPRAVGAGLRGLFAAFAADPPMAYVDGLAVYSGGPAPLTLRQTFTASYESLLAEGHKLNSWAPRIASEAIGACVAATLYDYARTGRAERLYEAAPVAIYLALAPFVPTARAAAIAVGDF